MSLYDLKPIIEARYRTNLDEAEWNQADELARQTLQLMDKVAAIPRVVLAAMAMVKAAGIARHVCFHHAGPSVDRIAEKLSNGGRLTAEDFAPDPELLSKIKADILDPADARAAEALKKHMS